MSDWIPTKDRLPPNDDWVLVTVADDSGDCEHRYVDFGWSTSALGSDFWLVDNLLRRDVVAWQPLPEPYMG